MITAEKARKESCQIYNKAINKIEKYILETAKIPEYNGRTKNNNRSCMISFVDPYTLKPELDKNEVVADSESIDKIIKLLEENGFTVKPKKEKEKKNYIKFGIVDTVVDVDVITSIKIIW